VVWGLRRQVLGQLITEAHADAHAKSTGVRPFSGGGVVGVEAPGGWLRWGGWREQPRLQRLRWAGWVELPLAKKEGALRLTARIWGGAGDEGSHEGAGAEDGRAAVHESLDAGWERRERLCIHHKRLSVHGSCEGVAASTHTTHTPPREAVRCSRRQPRCPSRGLPPLEWRERRWMHAYRAPSRCHDANGIGIRASTCCRTL
jgi:hypothetical protein